MRTKCKKLGYITGKRIEIMRIEKDLSQEELGRKIGEYENLKEAKRQTIANWEKSITTPNLKQLKALSEIFECDIAYLLGDTDFKRIDSEEFKKNTGLSKNASEVFIELKKRGGDKIIHLISCLLEESQILFKIAECCNTDYGHITGFYDIPDDIFSSTGKRPISFSPKMMRKADNIEMYKVLCDFIDSQRKKNGLSTSNEL